MLMLTPLSFAMCLCIVQAHVYCKIFAFEGLNVENPGWEIRIFSMKCFLSAFYIVALSSAVSLELFVSRAYVASYHAYHIYPLPVFLQRRRRFTPRKLHVSVQKFLCFFHQFD